MHLFHANVIRNAELKFMHGCRLANGPGFRVRAIHYNIISWFKWGVRRAALKKWSMKGRNISSCSCLTPSKERVVV